MKDAVAGFAAIRAAIERAANMHVKVGVLASTGGGQTHDSKSGLSTIEIAAVHEFGSPAAGIPERSFIRRTMTEKKPEIDKAIEKLAAQIVNGSLDPEKAFAVLGQLGAAEVKKTITEGSGVPPPLQSETIARKGSSRPLVDTGRLLGSIGYEVGKGIGEGGI